MTKQPKTKHFYSLRSFASYLGGYKLQLGLVFVFFIIANAPLAVMPLFIGKLVGTLAAAGHVDSHRAFIYAWILIGLSSSHSLTWRFSEFLFLKLLNPVSHLYETLVFKQVIRKPYPYFVDKFTGKVSSYVTSIGQELQDLMEKIFWDYAGQLVYLVAVSIILTAVNWQTGVIFIVSLLLMVIVGQYTIRNSARYEKKVADVQSTKNGKIVDAIANFVNVKSFSKENRETKTIEAEQAKTIKADNTSFVWNMVFWGSMGFLVRDVMWPATILLNVYLFVHHRITIADLATFLSTVLIFSTYIWDVIWDISQFNLKLARIEEAHTYLFGNVNIVHRAFEEQERASQARQFHRELDLQSLSFAYPDKQDVMVLDDIEIKLAAGEKLGIVGKSGSGKTTITKLLLGYYPVEQGRIMLDGEPIETKDLSQLISYVPQDTSLFHRSVAENIAYATDKQVSRNDIIAAAKQAHADEFIVQISEGYDALVGERGVKLSAGQRQRIAIARAFLDDKPILVLDEATSALDSESEVLVQQALEALWHDKTVIAIAHRLSTLRHMDKIIVLDKGRIIEQGSHQELIDKQGKYASLWAHQSGGFIDD
ncbi:MAG TPA: ABC transporter ATP-binding protein [Candidatus Saccharimonadales bacterium]